MPIFTTNDNRQNTNETETIIGSSVRVEGNFKSDGNISIDGVVQGSLKTNHDLKIGPSAKIKAEVETNNLFLAGEIKGNIKVKEKTQLKSTAKILGNLETKILSVEEGAVINGKCLMLPEQPVNENKKPTNK